MNRDIRNKLKPILDKAALHPGGLSKCADILRDRTKQEVLLRVNIGLSYQHAAYMAGVSINTVRRWAEAENGKRSPGRPKKKAGKKL